MKKIIVAVILMLLLPISYVGAEEKETVGSLDDRTLMSSKGNLPLSVKYKYYFYKDGMTKETEKADLLDCTDGQRRIINLGKMSAGDDEKKPHRGYKNTVWVTIQCMKKKGYVGTKHTSIDYPYPD